MLSKKCQIKSLFLIITLFFLHTFPVNLNCQSKISDELDLENKQILLEAVSIKPHPRQYEWQKDEFTAFIHFGVNTFTGREWGTGFEDPKIFNPSNLNTDQWCEAVKSAGMKMVIITAKHHDGFCLWPTRYTDHSVASSNWLDGNGDVLKELSKSCEKYDLKLGVYLSPADLFQIENEKGLYGNGSAYSLRTIPRKVEGRPFKDKRTFKFLVDDYNEYFLNQLFELLTEYGPIHEVWFDGAHPKRKGGQQYTYQQWYDLIRELAPEAVIFGKGPDVRWCGNEAGNTRKSEWSIIPINGTPENWTWPDMTDDDLGSLSKIKECLDNNGFLHWYPAETNTSIRHGWFWRDEAQHVKSVEEILDIWYRSVGGNSLFLLNIPPDNNGLLSARDVAVLNKVGAILKNTFGKNLVDGATVNSASFNGDKYKPENTIDGNSSTCWMTPDLEMQGSFEITLPQKRTFNRIVLQEQIQDYSQRVSKFEIDAYKNDKWETIVEGTTIGYKNISRIDEIETDRIKVRILESRLSPTISSIGLFYEEVRISNPIISRDKSGIIKINCVPPGPIIKFTSDGTSPGKNSENFNEQVILKGKGIIKAIAIHPTKNIKSEIVTKKFDICPEKWSIYDFSSDQADNNENAAKVIDGDENTNWISQWRPTELNHPHFISINLGEELTLVGFSYTPRKEIVNGTIKDYSFFISDDGKNWNKIITSSFENIKNNPVQQFVRFKKHIKASFIKLESLSEINGNPWASAAEIGVITE